MFKHIAHLKHNPGKYIYEIVDTCFVCEAPSPAHAGPSGTERAGAIVALISEYSRRNLNVIKNLALYYKWLEKEYGHDLKLLIDDHKYWLDKYYPQLEFGKRYYKPVLNQLNICNSLK